MTCSTKEKQLVEKAGKSTAPKGKSAFRLFLVVAFVVLLQIAAVLLVYTQYGFLLSHHNRVQEGQDDAVESIICVLRLPQDQRTDHNVTACLEPDA